MDLRLSGDPNCRDTLCCSQREGCYFQDLTGVQVDGVVFSSLASPRRIRKMVGRLIMQKATPTSVGVAFLKTDGEKTLRLHPLPSPETEA